jgi:hypothetical protein
VAECVEERFRQHFAPGPALRTLIAIRASGLPAPARRCRAPRHRPGPGG